MLTRVSQLVFPLFGTLKRNDEFLWQVNNREAFVLENLPLMLVSVRSANEN